MGLALGRSSPLLLFCSGVLAGACSTAGESLPADVSMHEEEDAAKDSDASPSAATDTGPRDVPSPAARSVSGRAWFFDLRSMAIAEVKDVQGAVVSVLELPDRRIELDAGGEFAFHDLPEGTELTFALEHPDFFPSLTRTFVLNGEDVQGLTFQAVSLTLAAAAAGIVGADPYEPGTCQMATTVTAISDNMDSIWAVGEPGATVSVEPAVPATQGPFYFNESVIPQPDLVETTADGGVLVAGAAPGIYTWSGHKEGFVFAPIELRCEAGWLTNAAPPYGLVVTQQP